MKPHPATSRIAAFLLLALPGGCPLFPTTEQTNGTAHVQPVFLVATERLEPPAVGGSGSVFKPIASFPVDAQDAAAGNAVGFFVTLNTPAPAGLRVALRDVLTDTRYELTRVPPPATGDERAPAADPRPFDAYSTEKLRSDAGVFWLADGAPNGDEHRFAVVLPDRTRAARVRLEFFTSVADDGTPLGSARLELVDDFFYVAILGDSVQWGNGLLESDKMSALMIAAIERETSRKVIWQRFAHSGARIVPGTGDSACVVQCWGETPTVSTSITLQAELIERPDLLDLVLMDGCINDVGVGSILNPATPEDRLLALIDQFCDAELGTLLLKLRVLASQAHIIVTGYYPIVGPESDILDLRVWLGTLGFPSDGEEDFLAQLARRSLIFRDAAHAAMRTAVDRVNAAAGPATIAFADPGFGPENAISGPDPWLWGLTSTSPVLQDFLDDLGITLFPEDSLQSQRLTNCFDWETIDPSLVCLYVSVGHPNPTGARAYAAAITAALRDLGVLPPVPP